jgi:hypothetical protein
LEGFADCTGNLISTPKGYAVISLEPDAMLGSIAMRTANLKSFIFMLLLLVMY